MIRTLFLSSLFAAALAAASPAAAQSGARPACTPPTLSIVGGRTVVLYDPFDADDTVASAPLVVTWPEGGAEACRRNEITIELMPDQDVVDAPGQSYAFPAGLRFEILDERGRSVSRQNLANALLNVGVASGPAAPGALQVRVRRGQSFPPGDYQGRFMIRTTASGGASVETPFEVGVSVQPSVRLGVETTLVDFDELEVGESQTFALAAFSNTGFTVEVTSDNNWRMRPVDLTDDSAAPYSVSIDGQRASSSGGAGTLGFAPPVNGFRPLDVEVTVGRFGDLPAGQYRDYLTFRISPRVS
jgi:hypothetical protein